VSWGHGRPQPGHSVSTRRIATSPPELAAARPWSATARARRRQEPDDGKSQTGPYVSERDFSQSFETVDWSQARYDDYGFIALDVTPAPAGRKTTMVLRFINQQGRELDRVVFSRIAGA
jgi:hypothetical protein